MISVSTSLFYLKIFKLKDILGKRKPVRPLTGSSVAVLAGTFLDEVNVDQITN